MRYFFLIFFITQAYASIDSKANLGYFSGRVTKINGNANLIRVKIDFTNSKYLNKNDQLTLWHEVNSAKKCKGIIIGRSSDHLLVKVPDFDLCQNFVFATTGVYLNFYSQDLVNNIKMGKELVKILLKKRVAIKSRMGRRQKEIDAHMDRVGAINKRYQVLRDKLDNEWQQEITAVERDKARSTQEFSNLQLTLDEIDAKLEQYRIEDENLKVDRWSLDPSLYYKK